MKWVKACLFCVSLFSVFASADTEVSESVHLSSKEAVNSIFHVKMPEDSVLTLSINGADRFSSAVDGSSSVKSEIDNRAAFFTFNAAGHYSVGAVTVCGVAFSVAVHVYSKEDAEKEMIKGALPKVVVDAPAVCNP